MNLYSVKKSRLLFWKSATECLTWHGFRKDHLQDTVKLPPILIPLTKDGNNVFLPQAFFRWLGAESIMPGQSLPQKGITTTGLCVNNTKSIWDLTPSCHRRNMCTFALWHHLCDLTGMMEHWRTEARDNSSNVPKAEKLTELLWLYMARAAGLWATKIVCTVTPWG